MPDKWNDEAILKNIASANRRNLELAGEFVKGSAKLLAPFKYGNLRDSMYSRMVNDTTVRIGNAVDYAPYQEFGTRGKTKKGFLRPALELNKSSVKRILDL